MLDADFWRMKEMKSFLRITGVALIAALLLLPSSVSGCTKDDPIIDDADIKWEFDLSDDTKVAYVEYKAGDHG